MHDLFISGNQLTAIENSKDFLLVGGNAPQIQVVSPDEIEFTGACAALSARGAIIVGSELATCSQPPKRFHSEADIIILSCPSTTIPINPTWLSTAVETATKAKIIAITPRLVVPFFKSLLDQIPVMSMVVSRDGRLVTEVLVRTTKRVLMGEYDPNSWDNANSPALEIRTAIFRIDTLTLREIQILELISDGLSNEHISSTLGIKIRTVNNFIGTTFTKLGLSGNSTVNSRVTAALAFVARKNSTNGIPAT